jgi:hypothetical protein
MTHLRSAYVANLLRNRQLAAELAGVVGTLRREGIEAIVVKGGALAPTVYADPAQRPMNDLDLLVRPEDTDRAGAVLRSLGFALPGALPARMAAFQQRFGGGVEWQRARGGRVTRLDLHHHLVGVDWCWAAFPFDSDALWSAARPLAVDGLEAWQLSLEDTLIHLCLHPALHGYAGPLLGYADVERVLTAGEGAFPWSRLVERAQRFRVRTVVYYGLQAAHHLLGTPLPVEVVTALEPDALRLRFLRGLAPLDAATVLRGADRRPSGLKQGLIYAALADPVGAGAGMVQRLLFPGQEWLATRYALETQGQARIYRWVHPLRLARAVLRGLHRPLVESSLE